MAESIYYQDYYEPFSGVPLLDALYQDPDALGIQICLLTAQQATNAHQIAASGLLTAVESLLTAQQRYLVRDVSTMPMAYTNTWYDPSLKGTGGIEYGIRLTALPTPIVKVGVKLYPRKFEATIPVAKTDREGNMRVVDTPQDTFSIADGSMIRSMVNSLSDRQKTDLPNISSCTTYIKEVSLPRFSPSELIERRTALG